MTAIAKLEKDLQAEIQKVQALQKELQKSVTVHSRLEVQLNENKIVQEELDIATEDTRVFKLVGSMLSRLDLFEARDTVRKRLEYIGGEMKRHEKSIHESEEKQEVCRRQIGEIQTLYQTLAHK